MLVLWCTECKGAPLSNLGHTCKGQPLECVHRLWCSICRGSVTQCMGTWHHACGSSRTACIHLHAAAAQYTAYSASTCVRLQFCLKIYTGRVPRCMPGTQQRLSHSYRALQQTNEGLKTPQQHAQAAPSRQSARAGLIDLGGYMSSSMLSRVANISEIIIGPARGMPAITSNLLCNSSRQIP